MLSHSTFKSHINQNFNIKLILMLKSKLWRLGEINYLPLKLPGTGQVGSAQSLIN